MNKIISALLIILPLLSMPQTIQIQGMVTDSVYKYSIPYCNIIIKNHSDSVITGALTSEKGAFLITVKTDEGLKLVVSNLGYKEKTLLLYGQVISGDYNLGSIPLSPVSYQLKGAEVTSTRSYMEQKFDRKVFNINEGKLASARTVLDLLRNLPGVIVDDDGGVRYKGANASVYVDNQPATYTYPKLEMIPVDNIDKIELIDVSMRSGGNGKGGIINIKLKAVNTDGFSGLFSTKPGTKKFANIDNSTNFINMNFKHNKIIVLNNYSFENNRYSYTNNISRIISTFNQPVYQFSVGNGSLKSTTNNEYFGLKYIPSENTNMNIGIGLFAYKYGLSEPNTFYEKKISNNEYSTNYTGFNTSDSRQRYNSINYSFWHQYDTIDTYIEIACYYSLHNSYFNTFGKTNYSIFNYEHIDSTYSEKNNTSYDDNQKVGFSVFYNKPISKKTRWNVAYYLNYGFNEKDRGEVYSADTIVYSKIRINNSNNLRNNLSFRIGTKILKWKIDGGINFNYLYVIGDFTRYKSKDIDTILHVKKNYFKILPSATISFEINKLQELKISLSQTTDFPYFYQLSDYVDKVSPFYWYSGNSEIKPVDFYSIYCGYTLTKEKWNASVDAFLNYTNNEVSSVQYPLSSLLYISKPSNITQKTNIGIDLSTWIMANKSVNISISSSIFHVEYNTQDLANSAAEYNLSITKIAKRAFGYSVKCNLEYRFKSYYAMLYLNYYSRQITFDGYKFNRLNSSFNISKRFFKNKLRLGLGGSNIFDNLFKHGSYSDNFGIVSEVQELNTNYKPLFYLSVRYSFRYGDRGTQNLSGNK